MGTSALPQGLSTLCRDHPHACGDKCLQSTCVQFFVGSSPRVWGQVVNKLKKLGYMRIIPTRVGTSVRCVLRRLIARDHPHACGDKLYLPLLTTHFSGSSPRVWGQVKLHRENRNNDGIIPTRVGTSVVLLCFGRTTKDHPHACGDKLYMITPLLTFKGSSPRVWGQAMVSEMFSTRARIIPTRVGTSST